MIFCFSYGTKVPNLLLPHSKKDVPSVTLFLGMNDNERVTIVWPVTLSPQLVEKIKAGTLTEREAQLVALLRPV